MTHYTEFFSHPTPQKRSHCLTLYVERRLRSVNRHSSAVVTFFVRHTKAKRFGGRAPH